MKDSVYEYYKIIIYTIFGLLLIISSYSIVLNIHHMKSLSYTSFVSDIDTSYVNFKKNITETEKLLGNYHEEGNNKLYLAINHTITLLKNDGVFKLIPNSYITYRDLNLINDYFMETIINNCWVEKLNGINKKQELYEIVNLLIKDTNYMRTKLINNGVDVVISSNDNLINNDYQLILKNYEKFSYVVLEMSKSLGGNNE